MTDDIDHAAAELAAVVGKVRDYLEEGKGAYAPDLLDILATAPADVLREHDAQVRAETLREFATWLDGGTPRAWGFHHPCDPPDMRWEPNAEDRGVMRTADYAREVADRIEKGEGGRDLRPLHSLRSSAFLGGGHPGGTEHEPLRSVSYRVGKPASRPGRCLAGCLRRWNGFGGG